MSDPATAPLRTLLPIMVVVFIAYLLIGVPLPVLPLHVHQDLGLSTFIVGIVAGSQFAAALLSRMWAGHLADSRGAKMAVIAGLLTGTASGALYLVSLGFDAPATAAATLVVGRALLGGAESLIITGALSWGLVLMGPQHTGTVMAWVGTALYAALAVGAPVGTLVYGRAGFGAVAALATLLPLMALTVVLPLRRPAAPPPAARPSFLAVARSVWLPGTGLAVSGVGFGAVTVFVALLFAERAWSPVWPAFTAFSVAFIVGRGVLGHLPDRVGGAKVALVCIVVEAAGLSAVWLAESPAVALAGVALAGLGYSLVYPGLGVEALRRAPRESRGVAMGTYTAFLDVSLGLSSPVLGVVASARGLRSVFLVSAVLVLSSAATAIRLLNVSPAAASRKE